MRNNLRRKSFAPKTHKNYARSHPRLEFDVNVLDQLAKDKDSLVEVQDLAHHLALHPYHLNDISNSIKSLLNQGIARYNARFDGILFGYKNIRFCSELGTIMDDSCFIHIDVKAEFFIFKPVVDAVLEGIVNKKSEDHVACLVHNLFNVSLPNIEHSDHWLGYNCNLNSRVSFKVVATNFDKKLPYIKGELIKVLSDSQATEGDDAVEDTTVKIKDKSKKKKKLLETSNEIQDEESIPKKSKTKKRKRDQLSDTSLVDNDDSIVQEKKKKKKIKIKKEVFSDEG